MYRFRDGVQQIASVTHEEVAAAARMLEYYGADLGPMGEDVVARALAVVDAMRERAKAEDRAAIRRHAIADVALQVWLRSRPARNVHTPRICIFCKRHPGPDGECRFCKRPVLEAIR